MEAIGFPEDKPVISGPADPEFSFSPCLFPILQKPETGTAGAKRLAVFPDLKKLASVSVFLNQLRGTFTLVSVTVKKTRLPANQYDVSSNHPTIANVPEKDCARPDFTQRGPGQCPD